MQGAGPGGQMTVQNAWAGQNWAERLHMLRLGAYTTRLEAYNAFALPYGNNLPGLGPAYFTKLLYFFSPTPTIYILDRWTAKSINLLNGFMLIKMNDCKAVHNRNTGENYQAYCEDIDAVAHMLGYRGEQVEQMLFSNPDPVLGHWRMHVAEFWGNFCQQAQP
jgi:hypothetical protein